MSDDTRHDEKPEREDDEEKRRRGGLRERLRDLGEDIEAGAKAVAGAVGDVVEDSVDLVARAVDKVEDRFEREGEDEGEGGRGRGRPTRRPGTSRGDIDGTPITPGQITATPPQRSWPGPRKDLYLPYLFFRAFPGDTGTRPTTQPFWESPDVYILPGVAPTAAPPVPPQLGQNALANADNTVYAHIWNLGQGPAREVVVEFYWCNPALGFNAASANRIGTAFTTLGDRSSGHSHRVVKCPESWSATYVNGGHECLLVRAWDVTADPMTTPEWDASINRHLGQRNIHVVGPGEVMAAPLHLTVGQLFGQPAQITVTRHDPTTMPWLQLHTGTRGLFPQPAPATGVAAVGRSGGLLDRDHTNATTDGQQVAFATTDSPPPAGSAHVYRVTASQQGQTFGGYTVVMLG